MAAKCTAYSDPKGRETLNKNKTKKLGCLATLIGTLVVLVATAIFAVISSLLCNLIISSRFVGETACALLPLSITVIGIAFVLFEIAFFLLFLGKAKESEAEGKKLKKLFKIAAPVCVGIALLLSIVSANTYTKLTESTISKVCFTEYKSYTWNGRNDVMRFTLACDENGSLTYTVTMKDGERIELFGSVNSQSDSFKEKYGNPYGYAAYLTKEFRESEYIIDERITGEEYMKQYYKDSYPEIWTHLESIINTTE